MRVPKGIMRIAAICDKDSASKEEWRSVNVMRMRNGRCRAEACDGFSAIRAEFEEPDSEMLPGFDIADEPVSGFTQMIPAEAAIDADAAIGKECAYLVIDEDPPEGTVRLAVPQAVNQLWDGKAIDGKFPPLDDILSNPRAIVATDDADANGIVVRISLNPRLLHDALKAILAATACEGVMIDFPSKRRGLVRLSPLNPARNPNVIAVLAPMHDDTPRRQVTAQLGGSLNHEQTKMADVPPPLDPELAAAVKSLVGTEGSLTISTEGKSVTIDDSNRKRIVENCDAVISKSRKGKSK